MDRQGGTRELVSCTLDGRVRYAWLCGTWYDEIERKFPELTVHRWPPSHMMHAVERSPVFEGEIDIGETASGLLHDILQAREGD